MQKSQFRAASGSFGLESPIIDCRELSFIGGNPVALGIEAHQGGN